MTKISDYPDLEGDEARRGVWLVDVPLGATHHLRNAINNGKAPPKDVLENYEIPIVASVLKLYLLELPGNGVLLGESWLRARAKLFADSIVSSQKYEIIKTVYATHGAEGKEEDRLTIIQNTLGTLPLTNIATLDALTTHFTRLIELTSADESFVQSLAQSLTNCILRPRAETPLSLNERHSYRLVRDLLAFKDQIFGALKRASTSASNRARAVSTDESQRRQHVEARNRAVASAAKSRSSSPAPPPRHGRNVSADVTRFPINTSPSHSPRNSRFNTKPQRESLEVPGAEPKPPACAEERDSPGSAESSPPTSATAAAGAVTITAADVAHGLEKKNSLGRSGHATGARGARRNARGGGLGRTSAVSDRRCDSAASASSDGDDSGVERVQLTDRPMEY